LGFGETVAVEGPGSDALKKSGFEFETSLTLELSKRPALIVLCAGAPPSMRERRINR
jgi:hypothetical protein